MNVTGRHIAYTLGGLGAGALGAYNARRAYKAIRKEKKNPKYAFSRTRKAWHRSWAEQHGDFERQFAAESRKHPRNESISGGKPGKHQPTWKQLAGEFTKKRKKHERRLKELSR